LGLKKAKMNRLFIVLLICLALIYCCTKKEKSEIYELTNSKQAEINNTQLDTVDDKIFPMKEIILPKIEISRESLLNGFPESPDYFIENGIDVTIYFGLEPVYVTGENFLIVYATDNGYKIKLIILKGKSIFLFWNQFFDATWSDVKKSWGQPSESETSWFNDTDYYGIVFSFNKMTDKIEEIRINEAP